MDIDSIIMELRTHQDCLSKAIQVLEEIRKTPSKKKKFRMSLAARRRISAAMKKNWIERKKHGS
jgi:hypothetical protein